MTDRYFAHWLNRFILFIDPVAQGWMMHVLLFVLFYCPVSELRWIMQKISRERR